MISRRGFLKFLGAATAVSAGGIALIDTHKTFFLPPSMGWGAQRLKIRRVQQYLINDYTMPYRYDGTWDLPNGEGRHFHVEFAETNSMSQLVHYDKVARQILEDRMYADNGSPNSAQFVLKLPRGVVDGCFLA